MKVRARIVNDRSGRGYSGDLAPVEGGVTEEIWEVGSIPEAIERAKAYFAGALVAEPWRRGYMVRMGDASVWFIEVQEETA